jgi:hypothetical protein
LGLNSKNIIGTGIGSTSAGFEIKTGDGVSIPICRVERKQISDSEWRAFSLCLRSKQAERRRKKNGENEEQGE